jgi:PAS domain S-box-containing protein
MRMPYVPVRHPYAHNEHLPAQDSIVQRDFLTRHLAKVVESSDDAIVSKDLNGVIISWNRAAERLFGYAAEEAIGKSIRMIIPADRQAEEDHVLARIRAGASVSHYETIRQRKDGTQFPISLTVSPVLDDTGKVIGASKIARDITEQVRLREAAIEAIGNAERICEVGAEVASALDRDTIVKKVTDVGVSLTHAAFGLFISSDSTDDGVSIVYATPALEAAFGSSAEMAAALGPFDAADLDVIAGEDAGQTGASLTHRFRRAGLHVNSCLAVPIKGWEYQPLGTIVLAHPNAEAFTDQHEQLIIAVAAWASLALENSRLLVEARDASRMKDEFLAVLSHEIRTPLNAIVGYAKLLRGGLLGPEKAQRGLETLERNATWLSQIVDDVLDVSRIVSGKFRVEIQPVDLALVVENAVTTIQPAADAKDIELRSVVDPDVGVLSGDSNRLQQVVWNLLANAVKFTPRGGRVEVRAERDDSQVLVIVSDTGIGIRPDFLPYVFDRFRQASGGPNRSSRGLGLGLAIVRHIVEMHGGTVQAFSAGDNAGATFTVRLPAQARRSDRVTSSARAAREAPVSLSRLAGIRVMAVDDEPDALSLLRVVLEMAGATVSAFSSPRVALDQIDVVRPDALLADIAMAELGGFELIARVRSSTNPRVRNVPAAALTAFARPEDRAEALAHGFSMHLTKPLDPANLIDSVASLVGRI